MPKLLLDIIMYSFEALLLYTYADDLFASQKPNRKKVIPTAAAMVILLIIYQFSLPAANFIAMFLLYFAVLFFTFEAKPVTAVLHTVLFLSVMVATEIIIMSIGQVFFDDFYALYTDEKAYVFVVTLSKLLYTVVMIFIKRLFFVKFNNSRRDEFYWLLFLLPGIILLINMLFAFIVSKYPISDVHSLLMLSIQILLLFASLVIFILYDKVSKNRNELYELRTLQLQQELDRQYFDAVEQARQEQMHFTHDMKNHLTQLRYMDEVAPMHAYLDSLISDVEKISYVGISTNKMLNLIIGKYAAICERKNITFSVRVQFADLHQISDPDLSAILNNLLDNAVEAAEQIPDSKITLSVFAKNSLFDGIIIRNTSTPPRNICSVCNCARRKKTVPFTAWDCALCKRCLTSTTGFMTGNSTAPPASLKRTLPCREKTNNRKSLCQNTAKVFVKMPQKSLPKCRKSLHQY